jgi:hypothetical protein
MKQCAFILLDTPEAISPPACPGSGASTTSHQDRKRLLRNVITSPAVSAL